MEDATLEDLQNDPMMQEAMQSAETGVFHSTMFQMWEDILDEVIEAASAEVSMAKADGLIRTFPWLTHADLPRYHELRLQKLHTIRQALLDSYPKPREILFEENEDDWEIHKDGYLEVLARWTGLAKDWDTNWAGLSWDDTEKGIEHAVVADTVTIIAGPGSLPEHLKSLRNFEITDEEGAKLQERVLKLGSE